MLRDALTIRQYAGQRELLTSIPGIAETTAARSLGDMPNITEVRAVKAVAAFAGLSPRHEQSGSIEYRSRLVKTGNHHSRRVHYLPERSGIRDDPPIHALAERLRGRRKADMTIVAAAMRKLVTLAYYGVLKSGRAFDRAFGHA
jgi:transposase